MSEEVKSWSRPSILTFAVGAATILSLCGSIALMVPFLPAITWSITLAIVVQPVYRRLAAPRYPSISAGVGVFAVALLLVGPVLFFGGYLAKQSHAALEFLQGEELSGRVQGLLGQHPTLLKWLGWLQAQFDLKGQLRSLAESIGAMVPAFLGGSLWIAVQLAITLFVLFYFLRDRPRILKWLRAYSPFTDQETSLLFGPGTRGTGERRQGADPSGLGDLRGWDHR
jgi:predicted PurR-regulated permease PerM